MATYPINNFPLNVYHYHVLSPITPKILVPPSTSNFYFTKNSTFASKILSLHLNFFTFHIHTTTNQTDDVKDPCVSQIDIMKFSEIKHINKRTRNETLRD